MTKNRRQRGYTVMEMLVVIAIMGFLMLITIPNFIVMRKSLIVKGAMRQFTSDLRAVRQYAVAKARYARISFTPNGRTYYLWESEDQGVTWKLLGTMNPKWLPENVYLQNSTGTTELLDSVASDGQPDIIFQQTGVADVPGGGGQLLLKTFYDDIPKPEYKISINSTGMVKTE